MRTREFRKSSCVRPVLVVFLSYWLPLSSLPVMAATPIEATKARGAATTPDPAPARAQLGKPPTKGRKAVKDGGLAAAADHSILLNVGPIDTASPDAQALREAAGAFEGKRLHLVQFAGPTQPEWYKDLEQTGVEVIQYIPSFAYLVYGDALAISRLQDRAALSPAVRWDGPYLDRYKVQAGAQAERRARLGLPDRDLFAVQLVQDPAANAATLELLAAASGEAFRNQMSVLKYIDVVAALPASAVDSVAARPDVVSIDRYVVPQKFDERQDRIISGQLTGNGPTQGDYLAYLASKGFTQAQFTASNFVVDVTDSGVDNATPASPNHFALRVAGNVAGVSRLAYSRLEGTPHAGSTTQGCDGHGNLNGTRDCRLRAGPLHPPRAGRPRGRLRVPLRARGGSLREGRLVGHLRPGHVHQPELPQPAGARLQRPEPHLEQQLGSGHGRGVHRRLPGLRRPRAGRPAGLVGLSHAGKPGDGDPVRRRQQRLRRQHGGLPGHRQERADRGRLGRRAGVRRRRRVRSRGHGRRQRQRHHSLLQPRPHGRRPREARDRRPGHPHQRRRAPGDRFGGGDGRRGGLLHGDRRVRGTRRLRLLPRWVSSSTPRRRARATPRRP